MNNYYQIHIDRYRFLLSQINNLNLKKNSKILDVGCYPPYIFNSLIKQGFSVYGISSPHEKFKHLNVKHLNLEKTPIPFPKDSFDLIIFSEVLEHLTTNISPILSEFHRILKPGGTLILTTPNVTRLQNLILLLFGKNIYFPLFQLSQEIYFRHNREYTLSELKTLLLDTKYHILNTKYFISYTPFRSKNRQDSLLLKIVKFTNYFLMSLFPSRRDTISIVAQK